MTTANESGLRSTVAVFKAFAGVMIHSTVGSTSNAKGDDVVVGGSVMDTKQILSKVIAKSFCYGVVSCFEDMMSELYWQFGIVEIVMRMPVLDVVACVL